MDTQIVNSDRLARTFLSLVRVDSISKEEGQLTRILANRLTELGARVHVDGAGRLVGGDTGNLIARIDGNRSVEPMLLSAHMDTVEPGRGVEPVFENGVFSSQGRTILGADDKSAIAVILEVLTCLGERHMTHGPLEIVFSICEEIGLLGAKHLDYDRLSARMGYVVDTRNTGTVVTRAPAANRLTLRLHGKSAHAGSAPDKGINAISLACKAIAQLEMGLIDHETTCNIGLIEGGLATNIVPELVVAQGEVRSHDERKLRQVTDTIVGAFQQVVDAYRNAAVNGRPRLESDVRRDFDAVAIQADHPVVQLAMQAAADLNFPMETARSGGGSDANVFAGHGITTGVLGTGMENVHTVNETVRLDDLVHSASLLLRIILRHAGA
jgi:tripeptide aminopeptidase